MVRSKPGTITWICVTLALILTSSMSHQDIYWDHYRRPDNEKSDVVFDMPIGNQSCFLGREAVLICSISITGNSNKEAGWVRVKDQTILTMHNRVLAGPHYSLQVDAPYRWTLKIYPLTVSDRGCYMCQINTHPYMTWQIGCIDVYVPPDIITDDTAPGDISVPELENVTLSCKATGHPKPKIVWRREDQGSIYIKKPNQKEVERKSVAGASLRFWRVDRRQMGHYLCIAANSAPPAVSRRVTLHVNFAPSITVPNQLLGAPLGTDVKLICNVEANPNTITYWVKNYGEMLLDGPKYIIMDNTTNYKTTMWLTIRNFSKSDIGTYNCVSTNSLGKSEGTIRIYEIKIAPNSEDYPYQISVAGGLTETSDGNDCVSLSLMNMMMSIICYVIGLYLIK